MAQKEKKTELALAEAELLKADVIPTQVRGSSGPVV